MKNAIEQVKVIATEEKSFTNDKGEVVPFVLVQAMSHEHGLFIFSDYKNKPELDTMYNMFLEHDGRMRAKITYEMVK